MFKWIPYAMVRVVLFFIGGILLAIYQPVLLPEKVIWYTVAFLTLTFFLFRFFFRNGIASGIAGLSVIFLLGFANVLIKTDSRNGNHFIYIDQPIGYYEAVVTQYPQEKEKSWKLEAEVKQASVDGQWKSCMGKVLLYFPKKDFSKPFLYGDVVLIKGIPQELTPPANPGEFDYKRFLTFRKTYHQHFIRKDDVLLIKNDPPNWAVDWAFKARVWADEKLRGSVHGEREQSIASALVLGISDGLDNELIGAYSATGALHVLAVSGLHVGIIYWIILLLLKPLNKTQTGKWTLAVISLLILWAYAFVTGLSPSVLRAVTMFSFVALARPWKQRTNIYNTLAASAFCLLLYEPYMVMSVGFQLSFIAVLGIVYLQPIFYQWWEPKNRLLDEIWKITCVSLAAQVATFSLGLLYFHQFPNYFLFSNLFVIPGSFVALVLGLGVLSFSFISPLAALLGFLLEWTIRIMNYLVFAVEALPFSLVENIYITTFQCWLLMGAIMALVLLLMRKKFSYLIITLLLVAAFSFEQWLRLSNEVDRARITVYKVAGHTAIDLIQNGQAVFLSDSVLQNDAERMRFHIRPNRLLAGVSSVKQPESFFAQLKGFSILAWNGQSILLINKKDPELPRTLIADWVVISNNSIRSLAELREKLNCRKIILDSSNSFYYADRLNKEAKDLGLDVHSVHHNGAFDHTL